MIAEGRLHVRVMTRKNRRLPRISKARLEEMIEQATVDAYNESEQITGWFTMIDENLAVPFETTVLGVPVTVERLDLNRSEQIVAICRRGRSRQSLPILDLPLPTPPPGGAEWIEAYRRWRAVTWAPAGRFPDSRSSCPICAGGGSSLISARAAPKRRQAG